MPSVNLPLPANPDPNSDENSQTKKPPRRRWRFQYSLRTLLIFVSVVGVLCGYLGMFIQSVQRLRSAVKRIQQLGGQVHYDYEFGHHESLPAPPGPKFVRWIFGDDAFTNVVYVSLYSETTRVQDKDLVIGSFDHERIGQFDHVFSISPANQTRQRAHAATSIPAASGFECRSANFCIQSSFRMTGASFCRLSASGVSPICCWTCFN